MHKYLVVPLLHSVGNFITRYSLYRWAPISTDPVSAVSTIHGIPLPTFIFALCDNVFIWSDVALNDYIFFEVVIMHALTLLRIC